MRFLLLACLLLALWLLSLFASYRVGEAVGELMGAATAYQSGVNDGQMSEHFRCRDKDRNER